MGFLYLTAFVCGGLIMVVEILGARVLGPLFGVGLFVWTAQIAVAMVALAAGYALGGVLTDRREDADVLFGLVAASALWLFLVPHLKNAVLPWGLGFGLRGGALVSASVLFGPPLLCLGCVSPGVIRLAARRLERVGRTAGGVYALSTVGSVLGTVLTGFVLIGAFGVSRIFYLSGAVLLGLCGWYLFLRKRPGFAAVCLLAAAGAALWPARPAPGKVERVLPSGTVAALLDARSGLYGEVRVIEYRYGPKAVRELTIDGLIQGGMDPASGLPVYEYLYLMERIPRAIRPQGRRCLVLGLGAGLVPRLYEAAGVQADAVELDPNVLDLARRHFGFRTAGRVFLEDARVHLGRSDDRYDYVVVDVFNGDGVPAHMVTLEAFRQAKARLVPGGVLALNFHGRLDLERGGTAAVARTLARVFENVDLYPTFDPSRHEHGNVAIIGYDGPPAPVGPEVLRGRPIHPIALAGLNGFWTRRVSVRGRKLPGPVLTDEHNPIDLMDLGLREAVRRRLLDDTPWDLLID
ncbi:fused MFS/spermidine synthase [Deferrisoma palaeochoriense]